MSRTLQSLIRAPHLIFVGILWIADLAFLAVVVHVAIRIGHLPSYDNPDPKEVLGPAGRDVADWALETGLFAVLPALLFTLARLLDPSFRERPWKTVVSFAGVALLLMLVGGGIGDWYFD
jgi:hypothetical protein